MEGYVVSNIFPFEKNPRLTFYNIHTQADVQLAGTFSNRTIPMHRSGHDFTCILDLPRGTHAYRYLVDNEWKYDMDSRKASDKDNNIHNFVDLTDFKNHDQREKERKREMKRSNTVFPMNKYGFKMLDHTDFSNEPPQLPPHLRHIILNSQDSNLENPSELPEPQTVTLNHLFCTAVKHDLMVLGTTSRYKKKFVTTVLYSKANLRR